MTRPKIIAFRHSIHEYNKEHEFDYDNWPAEVICCESFRDLSVSIHDNPALVVVAEEMIRHYGSAEEFMLMYDTLIKFSDLKTKPVIGIAFHRTTTLEEIKDFQKNNIVALIPSLASYGKLELRKSIEEFLATGKYIPKHLIEHLPSTKPKKSKFKNVHLTGRQQQVYDLIAARGLSNKQIAQVLKISESTVKIHVSAIMRALCVRNRTQLALTK